MADFFTRDIVKEFPTPNGPLRILDGVSVDLSRGQNLSVVGPSGSGKSTFLHIAGTLDAPTSGMVNLLGTEPVGFSEPELADFRNAKIGFVFQEHHLLPQLTALENVLIPVVAESRVTGDWAERGRELLKRVGLEHRTDHLPGSLSGGEKQRVAVARALIMRPVLVLADEPTGSLDQRNAEAIGELLLEIQSDENMLICVTHNDQLASKFQKQVAVENGKFVSS